MLCFIFVNGDSGKTMQNLRLNDYYDFDIIMALMNGNKPTAPLVLDIYRRCVSAKILSNKLTIR